MTAASKQLDQVQPESQGRSRRAWPLILLSIAAALLAGLLALGLWPAPVDFVGDEGTAGTGGGGLNRAFPAMIVRANNSTADARSDQRVALGRLLFFDPVLSGGNDISCATCHHPDLGFSDGRGLSMGKSGRGLGPDRAGGSVVKRAAPTLWNAAYNHLQFWDGRAADLEDQASGPITSEIEMAETPVALVKELEAIPEYASRFDAAFGGENGSSITFDNVTKAIAAFERTFIANDAPFDRYVKGDLSALTPAQRRGFNLFRSGRTRCFECHGLPTFANRDFKIIGVPDLEGHDPDYGRFDVTKGEGNRYAFKVPTLRNVTLNAPYMHNGRFKTLEEALDFYAAGAGPGVGFNVARVDDKIHSYSITGQEKADLIAFLYALTDESRLPEFPASVPSGLAVAPRLHNPARELVAKHNTGAAREQIAERPPQTITVRSGESIQAAVDSARPGDTIEVQPGIYQEEITIDLDNITLRGLTARELTAREQKTAYLAQLGIKESSAAEAIPRPVLDGQKKLSDAVIATGDNFHIEGFDVRRYLANGVVVQNARGPVLRDLRVDDTGLYGVYPVSCTGVIIERVTATGIADAAIYCGQSRDIIVRDCEAYENVTGIEIENSINAVVENNYVHDNAGGILIFVLPNNVSKVGRDCVARNNRVIENNHPNFGNPNAIVSNVPSGSGVLVMAADNTEVTANEIRGNNSYGVAVFSLEIIFPKGTAFDVGPTPDNTWIHGNTYSGNGLQPDEKFTRASLKGGDLVWDLSGWSNRWLEPGASRSTPVLDARWPAIARRAYWRALTFASRYL